MLLVCFCIFHSTARGALLANEQFPEATLNGCEMNNNYIDNAHHLAGEDSTIIVIARLGSGENNREVNRRRLHNVRVYLTDYGWQRDPNTVVTAKGDRVKGYGRIDLYVKGTLWASLAVRRNQDLIVGSCEPEKMRGIQENRSFYPYRDKKSLERIRG